MIVLEQDLHGDPIYQEAERLFRTLRQPGSGQISDAIDLDVSPDDGFVVFAGSVAQSAHARIPTRICETDVRSGTTRVLTEGSCSDQLPNYSPDGKLIAFLSDRESADDFQLSFLDRTTGAVRRGPQVDGWVEHLQWSSDGSRILLVVAGHGADVSSGQGAITTRRSPEVREEWMPKIEGEAEDYRWRQLWIFEADRDHVRPISRPGFNFWEGRWCGRDSVVAIVSEAPEEGSWYEARLCTVPLKDGGVRDIYRPSKRRQLGSPSASPSGEFVAVIEAVSSDRGFVAGELKIIDLSSTQITQVATFGVDVTYTEWQSDRHLLIAGLRGFESVVGRYDVLTDRFTEIWVDRMATAGVRHPTAAALREPGDCVLVTEGFSRAPEIAVIRAGRFRTVRSFDVSNSTLAGSVGTTEAITWRAPDGMEIQGWLVLPKSGAAPYPLVMNIHGGPVWSSRPTWLGRSLTLALLILRGYALFLPNPRGSSGRGQAFTELILGDMGGADTQDLLSGLDALLCDGRVDPRRMAVIGVSYGGFMTAWLTTQDARFAAAVAISPVTNFVTEHLLSSLPQWPALFLGDGYKDTAGKYYTRSPIMYADRVRTPTMTISGALDRCTPPEEGRQWHRALREHGASSVLVEYPLEGHGVRGLPAVIDCAARVIHWIDEHTSDASKGNAPRCLESR